MLKDISSKNIQLISEGNDGLIICNQVGYYWIDKNTDTFEAKGVKKIIDKNKVSQVFGLHAFCINGKWKHLTYDINTDRSTIKDLKKFPNNAKIIHHSTAGRGSCYLLKDNTKVFSYDEDAGEINEIENLDAATTNFQLSDWDYDDHFLYDHNTFLMIDLNFDNIRDVTADFKKLGLKHNFTQAKFTQNFSAELVLDFNDGSLWIYNKNGVDLENEESVLFYQIKHATFLPHIKYILHNKNLYSNNFDLINDISRFDVAEVADLKSLNEKFSVFYDKFNQYKIVTNSNGTNIFKKETNHSQNSTILLDPLVNYEGVYSYLHSMPQFYTSKGFIFFLNDNNTIEKSIPYKSKIKNLKIAYAFDNKLLIENQVIENIADYDTIEFIGSSVDEISGCDGGNGQTDIVIEYNYYFKDKNAVYFYHSNSNKMNKLENKKPDSYNKSNFFETLLKK
ncbi:hypothetical protein [Flavobacterium algicola]|uniref:hypothetical protein n=1 Tax=Flavobacterium algicola TaxID=556529 RepID=UPI001EFEC2EE|nr:hypothetical protein [Flavobacterium algicola]MCG9792629.1 hypothetical protein [Flavobacterium algicola]